MPGLVRANADSHTGHSGPLVPYHKTYYSSGSPNVKINNEPAIRQGDTTVCGDVAQGGSSTVFINGKPAHRSGDATTGHGGWRPCNAESGSPNVNCG